MVTPAQGLAVRRATSADTEQVCALLAAEYRTRPDTPMVDIAHPLADAAAHRWLYWDNPYGQPINMVWTEGGQVVAHAGLYRQRGLVEGEPVTVGRLAHVVTARAYRGRGLYGTLARRQQEALDGEVDLIVALPTAAAVAPLEGVGVMRRERALRWFRPITSGLPDLRGIPRPMAAAFARAAFGPAPEPDGHRVDAIPDDVPQTPSADGILSDHQWWQWRFTDNPLHDYEVYASTTPSPHGGPPRTTGLLAARTSTAMGTTWLHILHWQAVDADAAAGVLGAALAGHPECVAATLLATDGGPVAEWARSCGLRRLPSLLDDNAGHIALAGAPMPARHWNVSLASHHDQ